MHFKLAAGARLDVMNIVPVNRVFRRPASAGSSSTPNGYVAMPSGYQAWYPNPLGHSL